VFLPAEAERTAHLDGSAKGRGRVKGKSQGRVAPWRLPVALSVPQIPIASASTRMGPSSAGRVPT
jgi:hypothetical protein